MSLYKQRKRIVATPTEQVKVVKSMEFQLLIIKKVVDETITDKAIQNIILTLFNLPVVPNTPPQAGTLSQSSMAPQMFSRPARLISLHFTKPIFRFAKENWFLLSDLQDLGRQRFFPFSDA